MISMERAMGAPVKFAFLFLVLMIIGTGFVYTYQLLVFSFPRSFKPLFLFPS